MSIGPNIPLGSELSEHAIRRGGRRLRLWLPTGWPLLVVGAGMAASLVGVLIAVNTPEVNVAMGSGTYSIGGTQLVDRGDGVYQGRDGGVLVIQHRGSQLVAATSGDIGSNHMTGRCTVAADGGQERCTFTLAGVALGAVDSRTDDGWHRVYDDGQTVDIHVTTSGGAPVPFPIGH